MNALSHADSGSSRAESSSGCWVSETREGRHPRRPARAPQRTVTSSPAGRAPPPGSAVYADLSWPQSRSGWPPGPRRPFEWSRSRTSWTYLVGDQSPFNSSLNFFASNATRRPNCIHRKLGKSFLIENKVQAYQCKPLCLWPCTWRGWLWQKESWPARRLKAPWRFSEQTEKWKPSSICPWRFSVVQQLRLKSALKSLFLNTWVFFFFPQTNRKCWTFIMPDTQFNSIIQTFIDKGTIVLWSKFESRLHERKKSWEPLG